MSKEFVNPDHEQKPDNTATYLAPHLIPKVRSKIVPKVFSRVQTKLLMDGPRKSSLEKEADDLGRKVSEGEKVNVGLHTDLGIQKKDDDKKTEELHASGTFDPTTKRYTVAVGQGERYDTIWGLSRRFGISVIEIRKANNLVDDKLTPGQVLIIPVTGPVKEEQKPVARPEVKKTVNTAPKPAPAPDKKTIASTLIEDHTSFWMLDEEKLATTLVKNYLFSNPMVVSEVLNQLDDCDTDDVAGEIMKVIPETRWNKIDSKLLEAIKTALKGGVESEQEKYLITKINEILNPVKEQNTSTKVEKPIPKNAPTNVKAEKPLTTDVISNSEKHPYASQMDNKYYKENMYGDKGPSRLVRDWNQCNVTSLAMALRRVENENVLKNNTIDILIKNGGYEEKQRVDLLKKELEELILCRFEQAGTEYLVEPFRKYSGKPTFEFPTSNNNPSPHQYAFCLGYIGGDILENKATVLQLSALDKESYTKKIAPKLEKGYGALMGTSLTESGHVVSLVEVVEDGVIINDPYGLLVTKQGEYIINGQALNENYKKLIKDNPNNIESKLKYNSSTKELLIKGAESEKGKTVLPHTIGEKVFFTWAQVAKYNIGFWITLLKKN